MSGCNSLLLFLAPLLVACSPPLAPELGDRPGGPPAETIAVAPPELGYVPSSERGLLHAGQLPPASAHLVCTRCGHELERQDGPAPACPECGGEEWRERLSGPFAPRLDGAAAAARAAALLQERGGFSKAVGLPQPAGSDAAARRRANRDAAQAAGARWLLEPRLAAVTTRYAGQNGGLYALKVFNLIWTAIFIFPAVDIPNWFIASDRYALDLTGGWQLTDLRGGAGQEGELTAGVERAFAAFGMGICPSREWYLVGFLRVPQCLDEEAWAEIGGALVPEAEESLARSLVLAAEGARK